MLAVVQLAHGLTFGLTMVGTMGLMVRHVPIHVMARGQGYLAACTGIVTGDRIDLVRHDLRPLRAGRVLRDGGDGAVGGLVMWLARHRLSHHPHSAASGG